MNNVQYGGDGDGGDDGEKVITVSTSSQRRTRKLAIFSRCNCCCWANDEIHNRWLDEVVEMFSLPA